MPEVNVPADRKTADVPVRADSPCPCCGSVTIPNGGDALGFICPVCLWEIDLFVADDHTPSDQNHGLTLAQAQRNYADCGAVLPRLAAHSRLPLPTELADFSRQK